MSTTAKNFLLVAVDGGPHGTLLPLASACESPLENTHDEQAEREAHWYAVIKARHPAALLVGTSDTTRGRRIEAAARRAAFSLKLPIAAIEDFPGNYADVPEGSAGLLIVESDFARTLNKQKFGDRTPPVTVLPLARYDPYRAQLTELRSTVAAQCNTGAQAGKLVLWAGQPETEDALYTLRVVLPLLRDRGTTVLFKAHPRDPGYRSGVYTVLFASMGVTWRDVTDESVAQVLQLAPRLVITQFSSVAIEAGFYGVPSLHLLFAEAGGTRLKEKKGYAVPPLCLAGGAAHITEETMLATMLIRVLHDSDFRAKLIGCFDGYYESGELATPRLVESLLAFASESK